jgi:hypothetical protein
MRKRSQAGERARLAWAHRWGPVGSRVFMASFIVAAATITAFTISSGGSGADTAFNLGTATSGATAINIAPSLAQLNIAVELGASDADYEFSEAQALAQTLDLGVIGDVLEAPSCTNGAPSSVQASDFPAPVQAESTNGNQSLHATEATSLNGTGAGVGDEDATATQAPAATSTTTIASDDLAGLVDVEGATTSATTDIENGDTRYATATADISAVSIAKGAVVLKGLQWVATQTTGATNTSSSSFDIAGLTVGGINIPISSSSIASVLQIINTTLAPVGFEINWPAATTLSDGTVQISPLVVGIDNSALGQEIVGANLGETEPARNLLDNELFGLDCNAAGYVEIGDVLLGVPAGGGDLNIELGGAHAVTDDQTATSPFASFGGAAPPTTSVGSSVTSPDVTTPGTPGTPGTPATPAIAPTSAPTTTPPAQLKESLGPISKTAFCHSLSPAGGGCDNSNVAIPVGLIGLALLGLLAGWDFLRQRRRAELAAITREVG